MEKYDLELKVLDTIKDGVNKDVPLELLMRESTMLYHEGHIVNKDRCPPFEHVNNGLREYIIKYKIYWEGQISND